MTQTLLRLKQGDLTLCIDAGFGGHITEFSWRGQNALTTSGPAFGSTFWPSPQSSWGWPPLAALDSQEYQFQVQEGELILDSPLCEKTGLRLRKQLQLGASPNSVVVTYVLTNASDRRQEYAPWEITRLPGGVSFYQSAKPPLSISSTSYVHNNGVVWHEYQPEQQSAHQKLFGNGSSGWVANAYKGLLVVKEFEPVPDEYVAPGEGEVEIYAHSDLAHPYIEMEQQGRFQALAPGESLEWSVRWWILPLAEQIECRVDSSSLLQEVTQLLAGSAPQQKP